jgi:hypothetical protein
MRAILICYFFFLSFSCGSNISKEKVQEQEITIKKWINGCESTKLALKQINYMNEMIEGSELDVNSKEVKDIINQNNETLKNINQTTKTSKMIDDFSRSYSKIDIFFNKLNTFIYTIINDKEKLEMYKFEKDWFLPKGEETKRYSDICDIEI